jgi:hypothetical protein
MPKRMTETKHKSIDRAAVDALLVGIYEGLGFMGKEREVILEGMGDRMLEYLIKIGEVKPTSKPEKFRQSLEELFTRNGFHGEIPLRFKGSPPTPSMSRFINYLAGRRIRERGNKERTSLFQSKPEGEDMVDWVIYEMVIYGMTRGLDSLGAQGQILTNRIAGEMLDYLVDSGRIARSDDPEVFIKRTVDFFIKAGFADKIEAKYEGSPPYAMVLTYYHSRYHANILPRLRDAGNLLYSCPPCLAAGCILRRSKGERVLFDVEIRVLSHGRVVLRHKLYPRTGRSSEELAQKTSRMVR